MDFAKKQNLALQTNGEKKRPTKQLKLIILKWIWNSKTVFKETDPEFPIQMFHRSWLLKCKHNINVFKKAVTMKFVKT